MKANLQIAKNLNQMVNKITKKTASINKGIRRAHNNQAIVGCRLKQSIY